MSATAVLTFEQFEQLEALKQPGKHELIDGELISMPPPELSHTELMKRIYALFGKTLHESRVWPDHTGYRIQGGWIEPDVSIIWPDQPRDSKYFLRAPMLAVEILSEGENIERKLTLYFAEGAAEVWVVDRKHRSFTVYAEHNGMVIRTPVQKDDPSNVVGLVRLADIFS